MGRIIMDKIAIIIPSRLSAERLPNKPLELINGKEMILHVYEAAKKANVAEVYVASPDETIVELIKKNNGNAIKTNKEHHTGTDRIFEVFDKYLNKSPKIIVNLQGDMPNINPNVIKLLIKHMQENICEIGTLAGNLKDNSEILDQNIVKVALNSKPKINQFVEAYDFKRKIDKEEIDLYFHHVGIYGFTNEALLRYVSLKRSKLEIERKLEQLRALENKMKIDVGLIDSCPLSVDTKEDLKLIKKIMEKNEQN